MNTLHELLERFQSGDSLPPIVLDDAGVTQAVNLLKGTTFASMDELRQEYIDGVFIFANEGESIKIEQTRSIIEQAAMKSSGEYNIFVIEAIDTLTPQAANSLLKVFEDIPPGLLFLLTTSSGQEKMLETLVSRVIFIASNTRDFPLNPAILSLIDESFDADDRMGLMSYLYREKLDKEIYLAILIALQNRVVSGSITNPEVIKKIENGIISIHTTNANPRWIVDDVVLSL
ncbi:MAG: DNA polymerase III, delta prime subunit [uncultured bacterium (gcode 4)]|uniref:DNA polymerase III, delta prime subunit n=1 Tax=uncultured bacterium (gcode 4) TaxID=1234023 RepID=K1XVV5_9BACT|nr:MAG: DNA polymerase III, delta prime subunit [uncultured bacterium (gcode 4)]